MTGEFFPLDDLHMLCTKSPQCVLFRNVRKQKISFNGLENNLVPIFPITRSITIKNCSIRRKQVPMCPAFSLTDYKVQGRTLSQAVLDLKCNPNQRGGNSHRKFCSLYVQLSRLRSLSGLHLLQPIHMSDLDCHPHADLQSEMQRLQLLQRETLIEWKG
jgi:hypothetical protein